MNAPPSQDKFRAYRARKRAAGMRELRLWVPDVNAPGFQRDLDAQIAKINQAEDEHEIIRFGEDHAAEVWAKLD